MSCICKTHRKRRRREFKLKVFVVDSKMMMIQSQYLLETERDVMLLHRKMKIRKTLVFQETPPKIETRIVHKVADSRNSI